MARHRTNWRPLVRSDHTVAALVRSRPHRTVVAAAALVILAIPLSAAATTPRDAARGTSSSAASTHQSDDHQHDWFHGGGRQDARDHGLHLRHHAGDEGKTSHKPGEHGERGPEATPSATPGEPTPKPSPTAPAPKPSPSATAPAPKPSPSPTAPAPVPGTGTSIPTSFPDASTTGPRAGHALQASGGLTITQDGAVVSDLDINGCVTIQALNVVISDVRIRCDSTYGIDVRSGSVTVQHSELDGTGRVHVAVVGSNYTLSYVNIHNIEDGPRLGDNVTIEDSYIHDLFRTATSHNDAMQTTGATNVTIRHNSIVPATKGDPMNAAIMIGSEFNPLRGMLIEGNYLDGGNYTILARADLNGKDIIIRNNVFGRDFRYGAYRGASGMTLEPNNIYADTRTPI